MIAAISQGSTWQIIRDLSGTRRQESPARTLTLHSAAFAARPMRLSKTNTSPPLVVCPTLQDQFGGKPRHLASAGSPTTDWIPRSIQMNLRTMLKIWPSGVLKTGQNIGTHSRKLPRYGPRKRRDSRGKPAQNETQRGTLPMTFVSGGLPTSLPH
jgi:hypothetical protein